MRWASLFLLISIFLCIPFASFAQNFSSGSYAEVSPTIAPGGIATSTSYVLLGTMGEIAHSTSTSAHYGVNLGFFSFPFVTAAVASAVTGNASGRVDLSWSASIPYLGYTVAGYEIGRSTSSGGPYSYTAVGNVLASNVSSLTNGTPYYFVIRTLDNASIPIATSSEITATPTAPSLTFIIDSGTQSLPSLTPGVLAATSSILQIKTNNVSGFTFSLARSNVTATLLLATDASVAISDKSEWIAPSATTTTGTATASTTEPQTLQFRLWKAQTDLQSYSSTWWGSDDTTNNALFAGIPSTTQTIANSSVPALSTSTARVLYDVNVPATQKTGTYTGDVIYSATANP